VPRTKVSIASPALPLSYGVLSKLACSYIWGLRPAIVTVCRVSRAECGLVGLIDGLRGWLGCTAGLRFVVCGLRGQKDQGAIPRDFNI
jgi:hypothetical protein